MKRTNGYNWKFDRVNSKGEVIWKHLTEQSLEEVLSFLEEKDIYYEKTKGHFLRIYYEGVMYAYYYTTGRWARYISRGYPKKHYRSINIQDFYKRFLKGDEE